MEPEQDCFVFSFKNLSADSWFASFISPMWATKPLLHPTHSLPCIFLQVAVVLICHLWEVSGSVGTTQVVLEAMLMQERRGSDEVILLVYCSIQIRSYWELTAMDIFCYSDKTRIYNFSACLLSCNLIWKLLRQNNCYATQPFIEDALREIIQSTFQVLLKFKTGTIMFIKISNFYSTAGLMEIRKKPTSLKAKTGNICWWFLDPRACF